jgi:hypothetical protein
MKMTLVGLPTQLAPNRTQLDDPCPPAGEDKKQPFLPRYATGPHLTIPACLQALTVTEIDRGNHIDAEFRARSAPTGISTGPPARKA